MDKRFQIFISSTYEDLQDERKEVMQALLELDCIPAGMELFPASNEDQWTLIKKVIDDCDYYLLIVGGRYGSTNDKGISYTQMEFEYALDSGKPIISFLPKDPGNIPSSKCDSTESGKKKLEAFKKLAQKKLVKYWSSPQDLGSMVSRSVIKLIKEFPAVGWIKADNLTDENSIKEIIDLRRENEELRKQLSDIATQAPKGTETLAQGDDTFELHIKCTAEDETDIFDCSPTIRVTWNEIFAFISPYLIDECREYQLHKILGYFVTLYKDSIAKKKTFQNLKNFKDFTITEESFKTIKVQLKALGLIMLSNRKRGVKDSTDYWTLTQYGDHIMTQLLAIKKK
ncbi:MAG: DUF4062 domain-containing protein [Clostridiaceae bacterium]|nr:DUF4062 domain-containing protein [Clostridiaceae bacterium]